MSGQVERKTTRVLGVIIEVANPECALRWIAEELHAKRKGFVCFVSVHGLMEARGDDSFAACYQAASLRLPDGAPVAWVGRAHGETEMRRVAGPEMMLAVFGDERFRNAKHFFYGGQEGVVQLLRDRLQLRFPHANIVGVYTPPFRELTLDEETELAEQIREVRPDIMWVGIGCPKQERFMLRYRDRLDTTLMFGVGAAFDYHTGRIQDSPMWMKRAGLQWLHRLMQDPRRLWRRYLMSNTAFLWALGLEFLGNGRRTVQRVS